MAMIAGWHFRTNVVSRFRLSFAVLVGSVVLCFGSGCSNQDAATKPIGQTYPVTGKIVLSSGKPLTSGRVFLVGEQQGTPPSSGEIQSDGAFKLTTKLPGDGAMPGKYKLRIEPIIDASKSKKGKLPQAPFPNKYLDEDSSEVYVTVKAEPTTLDTITLK